MLQEQISVDYLVDRIKAHLENSISLAELDSILREYMKYPEQYLKDNSKRLFSEWVHVLFSYDNITDLYYHMSAMFRATMIYEAYYELIKAVIEDTALSKENKVFAYWQISMEVFVNPTLSTPKNEMLLDDLYEDIYLNYLKEFKGILSRIPMDSRNEELVFVFTSQVLSLEHGPTKTLLDRCYILEKVLHKRVFIINTADQLTENGLINWFGAKAGNYKDNLSNVNSLEYQGCKFMFYQCPNTMPDTGIIREILKTVIEEKPWFIVSIGGDNITADLCAQLVPVLTISTVPSKIAETRTTFQMTGHKPDDKDRYWLSKHGYNESHIINGIFTSAFKEQTHKFCRKELKLPENMVVCLVVGIRLDDEIDEDFIRVICKLSANGIYTAFMGKYKKYDTLSEYGNILKDHIINLGMQNDALAVYECCDIYINPRRRGGGTSVAEAMFKGLPAVTLAYGDVATGAGEEFCVESYEEMTDRIIKLATDKEYYKKMSNKARQRASTLVNSEVEFARIINEMESRKEFW